MSTTLKTCALLLCSVFVSCIDPPEAPNKKLWSEVSFGEEVGTDEGFEQEAPNIPQIPVDILQRVAEMNDASQFMDNFVKPEERGILTSRTAVSPHHVGRPRIGLDVSKIGLSKKIARHALCTPSPQVVELAKEDDPLVLYYPTCTRVNRCGGCCRSNLLTCQPSQKKTLQFQVIKTRYSNVRARLFNFEALENITVEEHTKCKCQCKIQAQNCNDLQIYRSNECRCECKNQHEADNCRGSDKFWDANRCACTCKNHQDLCSTGLRFSNKICRCIPEEVFRIERLGEHDAVFGRTVNQGKRRLSADLPNV